MLEGYFVVRFDKINADSRFLGNNKKIADLRTSLKLIYLLEKILGLNNEIAYCTYI